ncbi:MAG TPA: DCC1-like thiol-disulfide oxidoreductase family protein [Planctomycetota bacterium]|nr:DCC1-like thiol-disulfide oxidoreductase family protein [Planctomycetota bacterium]
MTWNGDIVLFDGGCERCDRAVRFLIAHDRRGRFRYAPQASHLGRALRARHGMSDAQDECVALIGADGVARGSTAVLRIARRLGWPWCLGYALIAVPRPVRDLVVRALTRGPAPAVRPAAAAPAGSKRILV